MKQQHDQPHVPASQHARPPKAEYQPPAPVRLIPLEQIVPNPHQPRRHFDEAALQELADSIRQHGVLQPILLRQRGDKHFEIIAGERRYRASKLAGSTAIPALVRKFDDRDQAELSLIENLQREDLTPVETARAFQTLMQEFGMTQTGIARRIGKAPSTISHLLRLLQLPEEILDALNRGELQEGHAQALLQIQDAELRERLCRQVIAERLSVREIRHLLREATEAEEEPTPPITRVVTAPLTEAVALQEQLTERLGRPVTIRLSHLEAGELAIGFTDGSDMRHLAERLRKAVA